MHDESLRFPFPSSAAVEEAEEEWKSYSFDHRCGKATSFTRHLLLVDNFTSSERERRKSGSTYNVTNGKRLNSTSQNEWNFLLLCSRKSSSSSSSSSIWRFSPHCCCSCANCEKMRFLSPRASCCSSAAACHCVSEGLKMRKKAARNEAAAKRRNKISVFFMVTFKRLSRSMMGLLEINIHFSFTLLSRSTLAFSLQRTRTVKCEGKQWGEKREKPSGWSAGVALGRLCHHSLLLCVILFFYNLLLFIVYKKIKLGRKERRFINESTHEIAFPGSFHAPSTALGLCVIETLYARSEMKWKDMLVPSSSHECSIFCCWTPRTTAAHTTMSTTRRKEEKRFFPFLFSLPIKIIDDDEQCSFVHLVLCSFLFIWTHLFLLLLQSYYRSSC